MAPVGGAPDNRLQSPLDGELDAVGGGWQPVIEGWRQRAQGRGLVDFVERRRADGATIFPRQPLRALHGTPRDAVRAVILGQDPYHRPGQAEGLAFSVPDGVTLPPSLRNVLQEWRRDLGRPMPAGGHLGRWARAGVLLLNTTLTVEEGRPASHVGKGWEALTDDIISMLADDAVPKVFMLWGAHAQAKRGLIAAGSGRHLVLECNHPSPLSARRGDQPFLGCGHFGHAAAFLAAAGRPVDWSLP